MNVLLIGGGGFLGVPLANELSKTHSVLVYDNFKHDSQAYFNSNVNLIKDEVKNLSNYKKELKTCDIIYYLACPRLHELTEELYEQSFHEFKDAFSIISKFNRRFIYTSSCSVYGNKGEIVDENSQTQVTSLYSKLKIACEQEILTKPKFNHLILRLSTLYGNSYVERKDIFINNLVDEILKNKYVEIYDPLAIRPHLHVRDASIILSNILTSGINCGILNVGNNNLNISKEKLIHILKELNIDFSYHFNYTNDSRSYKVDFSKLEKHIQHNFIDFKKGILDIL